MLVDGDGCRSADDGGDQRRISKAMSSVLYQSIHDGLALSNIWVYQLKGKAAPLGPGFGTVKGQDHHGHDRRI